MRRFAFLLALVSVLAVAPVASGETPVAPALVSPASGSALSPMEATLVWELPPGTAQVQLEVTPAKGAMYWAERIGQTRLYATGELPCHRAQPPCLAPQRLFEVQVRVGARLVREPAPIESAAVRSEGGEYFLDVVQGLPSGCVEPDGHTVARESEMTVRVRVFNRAPADPGVVCTAIYGMYPSTIPLGRDFAQGKSYTVLVNDRTVVFTAG